MIFFVGERIACPTSITVQECFYNLMWTRVVKDRMHSNKGSYCDVAQINGKFVLIVGINWYLYPLGRWHNCNPNAKVTYQICRKCSYYKCGVKGLNCMPRVSPHIRMTPVMLIQYSSLIIYHKWLVRVTLLVWSRFLPKI